MSSTRIVINNVYSDGEYKKYQSTQEQIDQNRAANQAQRERDESAQNQSSQSGANQPRGSNNDCETAGLSR